MIKIITIFVLAIALFGGTAFACPAWLYSAETKTCADASDAGKPVNDEAVFNAIRQHYDGHRAKDMDGTLAAERLKNQTFLIELKERLAEFTLYNLIQAQEEKVYIPEFRGAGWLNYFDRVGDSIHCGLSSYNLKEDPFPDFKCRFTIDSDGNIKAFQDRSFATSDEKPSNSDGKWGEVEQDFHWARLSQMSADVSVSSNGWNAKNKKFIGIRIQGRVAAALYDYLTVKPQTVPRGPHFTVQMKFANYIQCFQPDDKGNGSCIIEFDAKGQALPVTKP